MCITICIRIYLYLLKFPLFVIFFLFQWLDKVLVEAHPPSLGPHHGSYLLLRKNTIVKQFIDLITCTTYPTWRVHPRTHGSRLEDFHYNVKIDLTVVAQPISKTPSLSGHKSRIEVVTDLMGYQSPVDELRDSGKGLGILPLSFRTSLVVTSITTCYYYY